MQHSTDDLGVKIVPAILMSFVLVGALGWSAFGNLLGGLVLVTSVRLLRVPHRVAEERANREDD